MSEIRALRTQVALTAEVVGASLIDVTHEDSLRTPVPGANGMNWIVGHLVHVNAGILELLERPGDPSSADLARYAGGTPPVGDGTDAWALSELRDAFVRQAALLDQALVDAPPELLSSPPPPGFEGELRDFMHFIAFHQGYHAGQLGMLRRAMGRGRAFG